jgi:hypothetical protein
LTAWLAASACGPAGGPDVLGRLRQAAGPYAGGLDVAVALSVSQAQSYQSQYGISWCGAYVGGACNGGSGWTAPTLTALAQGTGWKFMPIYVGQQDSSICSSSTLTGAQGTADGQDTVAVMGQYAWAPDAGIPVCLDIESGTYAGNPSATLAYVSAWADAVHAGGYKAYVYSSPAAINAFASSSLPIDAVWMADWTYSPNTFQADLSPYDVTSVTAFTNHDRAWQYCDGTVDSDTADLVLAPAPGQTNVPPLDAGSAADSGTVGDAGSMADAGDAGSTGDAGTASDTGDAGPSADGGTPQGTVQGCASASGDGVWVAALLGLAWLTGSGRRAAGGWRRS